MGDVGEGTSIAKGSRWNLSVKWVECKSSGREGMRVLLKDAGFELLADAIIVS
jgi:hypothetical protein